MVRAVYVSVVVVIAFSIFSIAYINIPKFLDYTVNVVSGLEEVEYVEEKGLYEGELSVDYNTYQKRGFLGGIFGSETVNEVYITDEEGFTEYIPYDKIDFEFGDSWVIRKSGVQQRDKEGRVGHTVINKYTIIGEEGDLVELSSGFTKTFGREYGVNLNN